MTTELFESGWLKARIEKVMAEIESYPEHLRPRLTGADWTSRWPYTQCPVCFLRGRHKLQCPNRSSE